MEAFSKDANIKPIITLALELRPNRNILDNLNGARKIKAQLPQKEVVVNLQTVLSSF